MNNLVFVLGVLQRNSRLLLLGVAVLLGFLSGWHLKAEQVKKQILIEKEISASTAKKLQDRINNLQKTRDDVNEDFIDQTKKNKKILTSDCTNIDPFLLDGFNRMQRYN
jgi:hypothetical protein